MKGLAESCESSSGNLTWSKERLGVAIRSGSELPSAVFRSADIDFFRSQKDIHLYQLGWGTGRCRPRRRRGRSYTLDAEDTLRGEGSDTARVT